MRVLLLFSLAILGCLPAAAAVPPAAAPDAGYEETIPERWSALGVASAPFPVIPGLRRVRSLAAAGTAAIALDIEGASVALTPTAAGALPALWQWRQPPPPSLQRSLAADAGSCVASIAGAEDIGSVLVTPDHGVQHVCCEGATEAAAGAPRCAAVATLAPAAGPLAGGISACAAATTGPPEQGVTAAIVVYVIVADGSVWTANNGTLVPVLLPDLVGNTTTAWNTSMRANALAVAPGGGAVAVATRDKLYTRAALDAPFYWEWASIGDSVEDCAGAAVTYSPTALLFTGASTLYIGHAYGVQRMDLRSGALTALRGLPCKNVTSLAGLSAAPDTLFVGTTKGMARISAGAVRYFFLSRWLPGEAVVAMAALPTRITCNGTMLPPAVAVATDVGIAVLTPQCWTLSRKARYFQSVATRHNRYGYAAAAVLPNANNFTNIQLIDDDNDGTELSVYAASQIFRRAAGTPSESDGVSKVIKNSTGALAFLQVSVAHLHFWLPTSDIVI